ncbi:hypothetical protein L7F22_004021 [Adiantum nelumboides]|nr:hypothetical protein [Adiantum nelumboides]
MPNMHLMGMAPINDTGISTLTSTFLLHKNEHVHPCSQTIVAKLKACAKVKDVATGSKIHSLCVNRGLLRTNIFVGNALIHLYAKCGRLQKAQEVFDSLPSPDIISWNVLLAGYVQHDRDNNAIDCFRSMELQGVACDPFTYSCILKACGHSRDIELGKHIHMDIERKGFLQTSTLVGNALIDMYVKCCLLLHAHEVFDMLPVRNVVSWTSLIAGYLQQEQTMEALHLFEQMQSQGVSPDAVAVVCCLKACGSIAAKRKGQELHAYAKSKGFLASNLLVGTALVDMYVKCGMLAEAQEVFNYMQARNIVSWNSLIAGFAQHKSGEVALKCYERMKLECVFPDAASFTCSLKACGGVGAIEKGRELHTIMNYQGLLETSQLAGNALVDMYAKGGMLKRALRVFNELPVRNIVSWNALITGYARLGEVLEVCCIFDRMMSEGIVANPVTCLCVLSACSRSGLVDKGQTYFQAVSESSGFIPTFEHYACMVDLLGRAGQLETAFLVLKRAPSFTTLVMWLTLLGACRKWGNVELASQVFEQAVLLYEKEGALYTCMSNIYEDAGLWADAKRLELMRR